MTVLTMWVLLRERPIQVTYAEVRNGPMLLTVATSGKVEGEASDLAFTVGGRIFAEYVKEGDYVAEKQLLARSNLADETGTADVLEAPFAGSIVAVYRKTGEVVNAGVPVMRIVQRAGVYVTAYLDSEDAAWIKPGDRLKGSEGGYLSRPWALKVVSVGSEAVPRDDVAGSTRQVRARLAILDADFSLPPGTDLDIDGDIQIARSVLQVPASAIVRRDSRTFVWLIKNGLVKQVEVGLGPNNFRYVAVLDGLSAGDRVVLEGKTELKSGQAVASTAWEDPQL